MKLRLFFVIIFNLLIIQAGTPAQLKEIARSDKLWTGVAVSKEGRIFVNYPRWSLETSISVAELSLAGEAKPYPDPDWNQWSLELDPTNHFICVQSVYIDSDNFLWVLDPANSLFQGVVEGGAKLLKIDLSSNQVIQNIIFDTTIAPPNSYLNDVRIDVERNYAYLTDSGLGAIVVVDLSSGKSRRVLQNHPSTRAEDITLNIEGVTLNMKVHSDGLALTPDKNYLYYQALSGRKLYRIATRFLRDPAPTESSLSDKVEFVTESGACDAIEFDPQGYLYLSSLELNAIRRYTPTGKIEMVIQDSSLKWPDSFSITPDGTVYVTTSQLHLGNSRTEPYKIFQIVLDK